MSKRITVHLLVSDSPSSHNTKESRCQFYDHIGYEDVCYCQIFREELQRFAGRVMKCKECEGITNK